MPLCLQHMEIKETGNRAGFFVPMAYLRKGTLKKKTKYTLMITEEQQ